MANGNGKRKRKRSSSFRYRIGDHCCLLYWYFLAAGAETIITVQTEKVQRRTITQIVSATGKIQPENTSENAMRR